MATEITKWKSENGKLFCTREEAEQEDIVCEIAEILDTGGNEYDEADTEEMARALLQHYEVKKRIVIE